MLDDEGIVVQFSPELRDFSLRHKAQTGSRAHPLSYTMGTGGGGYFPGAKVAGV
jgi:hypothetical protein